MYTARFQTINVLTNKTEKLLSISWDQRHKKRK